MLKAWEDQRKNLFDERFEEKYKFSWFVSKNKFKIEKIGSRNYET